MNARDNAGRTALIRASSRWKSSNLVGILLKAGEQSKGVHSEMTNG